VLRARITGPVTLQILARSAKKRAVAVGRRGLATYRNGSRRGMFLYLEVRPQEVQEASYTVRVTAARR
jgi:hypothetical protein